VTSELGQVELVNSTVGVFRDHEIDLLRSARPFWTIN